MFDFLIFLSFWKCIIIKIMSFSKPNGTNASRRKFVNFSLFFRNVFFDIIEVLAKNRKSTLCIFGLDLLDQTKNASRRKNRDFFPKKWNGLFGIIEVLAEIRKSTFRIFGLYPIDQIKNALRRIKIIDFLFFEKNEFGLVKIGWPKREIWLT